MGCATTDARVSAGIAGLVERIVRMRHSAQFFERPHAKG
jgi:hypothetical protein